MIFDKLCGIIEREPKLEELREYVEQAAIFEFPGIVQDVIPKEWPEADKVEKIDSEFFLPFPVVAIEDAAGCEIIIDTTPNQIGLSKKRLFISISSIDTPPGVFAKVPEEVKKSHEKMVNELPKGTIAIQVGAIKNCTLGKNNKETNYGGVSGICFASKEHGMITNGFIDPRDDLESEDTHKIIATIMQNIFTGTREIAWFNREENFVVKKAPKKAPKQKTKKGNNRLFRSHERPTYIHMGPREIDNLFPIQHSSKGTSPKAHRRRAHRRLYTDERYINMIGKTQMIAAQWIGPEEVISGNRRYKVMLDI